MDTPASEIMSREVATAKEGISVEDALKLLMNLKITGLPVINEDYQPIGVLSEFDLLTQISSAGNMKAEIFHTAAKFTRTADSISDSTPLKEVMKRFVDSKYRRLPVVDAKGKLVGIITRRDLIRVFYYRAKLT